jgi:hypothetical protein
MNTKSEMKAADFPPSRDRVCPFDPPKALAAAASKPGLTRVRIWDGQEPWLVTRYQDCQAVLGDERFSANPTKSGFPEKSTGYKASIGQDKNIRTMDNPEHGAEKRMISRDFAVMRLQEMRPSIEANIDSLIEGMLAKGAPADIVTDLAFPVPTQVICELLGVPYAHRDWFAERSMTCLSSDVALEESSRAGDELYAFMERMIDEKDRNPTNDLTSRLVVEQLRTGKMSRKRVVEMARLLLIVGHETTANMIAMSVVALLRHPDQLAALKTEPSLLNNAVEELLRYLSVSHTGRRRVATQDVEVAGQLIRAGEGVIVANSMADRDPTIFAEPGRLDIRRKNATSHMAFGYGIHQCIGQMLSRIELRIVHDKLWRRMPTLALAAPFETLEFREETSVYGIRSLPVTW